MTLTDQLNRLSEIAPEVCQPDYLWGVRCFTVGEYSFWVNGEGPVASYDGMVVRGRPALAWLRDAIEGEIEARGWYLEISKWNDDNFITKSAARIIELPTARMWKEEGEQYTETLLAAFVAAMEEER